MKATPLLATPPTVTTTFPVVALAGTGTTMLVADQVAGVATMPLKVTVLVPLVAPKLAPAIVTDVPTGPLVGLRVVTLGAGATAVTVNARPLLATPPTVTTTFPVVALAGTGTTMLVADQVPGVATMPVEGDGARPLGRAEVGARRSSPTSRPAALVGLRVVTLGAGATTVTVNARRCWRRRRR